MSRRLYVILIVLGLPYTAMGQSDDAGRAVILTQTYLAMALSDPAAIATMRHPDFAALASLESFVANWTEIGGTSDDLTQAEITGVTPYDRDADGAPATIMAIDFFLMTAEPRLICGYLIWDMSDPPLVLRQDVSYIPGDVLASADGAAIAAFVQQTPCRLPAPG